ncbi:MAG: J domain-containing protein, partial [Pirellulales bacterium]|nr:J domain-containing protein [Pirellulales bacterium]
MVVQRASGKTETITATIPAGIEDGKKIRLRGQGEPAPSKRGKPGDILITIHIAPHAYFTRKGNNLHVRVPVTLAEAVDGAKVDVPTPGGT